MDILELMKYRRSIRKYQDKQITREELEKIIEAGLYAPNAGGEQRAKIVAIHNKELVEKIGRLNIARVDRKQLEGRHVSSEQPSIIDDASIKSGFYGAPSVCILFAPEKFPNSIPDAFCCAENMVLEAANLGIGSCIVGRAEETFANEYGEAFMKEWGIPEGYIACGFVVLGYCEGDYPKEKLRKADRYTIIE